METVKTDALEASNSVLLLVDFINPLNFDGAAELTPSPLEAATQTAKLRRRLAREGVRAVYANDNYGERTADFNALCRRCHAKSGPAGHMAKLLAPRRQDFAILKPRHSAFYATPLQLLLEQLRCKRLIVAGIAADTCVLFTEMGCLPAWLLSVGASRLRDRRVSTRAKPGA